MEPTALGDCVPLPSKPLVDASLPVYGPLLADALLAFTTDCAYLVKMADNARRVHLGLPPLPFSRSQMPKGPYAWWGQVVSTT